MTFRVSVVAASVALSACQCDEPPLVRVAPEIAVAADRIDFGEVPVGATKRVLLQIDNVGNAELVVVSATTAAPFGVELVDALVPGGGVGYVDVAFTPTNADAVSGEVIIESNDEQQPRVVVPTSGRGVAGLVTVQPRQVDFRETTVGVTRAAELLLSNFGLEPVEGRIVAERFARPEHFSLTTLSDLASTGSFSVSARGELVLDLEYRPLALGPDGGRLIFETCGDRCGLQVDVTGSGSEAAVRLVPPSLDFGVLGIGDVATKQLLVENIGNDPVQILGVTTAQGPGVVAVPSRAVPTELAAGDSMAVTVELTALAAGDIQRAVVVETTDPVAPVARATVVAQGQGPQFGVAPESLTFDVQREAIVHTRQILLTNTGSTRVNVASIAVSGDPEFGLAALPGLPASLGAGESLLVGVTFAPTVIGGYSGTVTITSDDPATPIVEVPVTGGLADQICELDSQPARVNFGALPPGFSRRSSIQITNVGFDTCTVTSGAFRAPVDPAIRLTSAPWPITLAPQQSQTLEFEFAPTDRIESKGNFTMQTTDPVFPERHVTLAGTGQGYVDLFTTPESIDFGSLSLMCQLPARDVTLYNAGTIDVTIDRVVLTSSTSEFTLGNAPMPGSILRAGDTVTFEVGYVPLDVGVDTGLVEIHVVNLAFPLIVPVTGEGALIPRVVDVYQQPLIDMVDVLFVIDDSCSMGDDQAALAANFQNFIRSANVRQIDFQIGITRTTLVPNPGALVGPILRPSTSGLEAAFQNQANVGVLGSGFEQGLEAMSAALRAAELGFGFNQGFLRNGAARVVVIVSDEDDQSPGTPVTYFTELRTRSPNGFTAIMITGGPNGCVTNGQSAFPTPRYEAFRRLTQGIGEPICNDWAMTLTNVGNAAFGLGSFFGLSSPADLAQSIEVIVDGVPLSSGWQYDPMSQGIRFDSPPQPGATVRIRYSPAC